MARSPFIPFVTDFPKGPPRTHHPPNLPHPDPEPTGYGMRIQFLAVENITPHNLRRLLPFKFQVPPLNTFPINRSYPWTDYDPIEGGQRSRRGSKQLTSYSWRTLFTADPYKWTLIHGRGYVPNPINMLRKLDQIATLSQHYGVPLIMAARSPKLWQRFEMHGPVTIRSLNSEEVEGEPDTRYVDIQVVQWRDTALQAKRIGGGTKKSGLPVTKVCKELPAGKDTLYELAKDYYGSPSLWTLIAKANGLKVTPTYDLNKLGNRRIKIPKRP
jgi:hypothetical protein